MINEKKAALRAELRALRAALSEDERAKRNKRICDFLISLLDGVSLLLLFYPKGAEINLRPVFHEAIARGIPCAFPRCADAKGEIRIPAVKGEVLFAVSSSEEGTFSYTVYNPRAEEAL